jgi:uncharacterized protein (TIGR03437 family)
VDSASFNTTIVASAPSLYFYPVGSTLYAAATHVDGSLIGDPALLGNSGSKAKSGEVIVLYVNGLASSPSGMILGASPYSGAVTVTFTNKTAPGTTATVTASYAGIAFAGGFQVNLTVPQLPSGNYSVLVATQGQSSDSNVVIPVQ